jgi:hypothetical protein
MSASFQVNAGPFSIDVQLDDSGIRMSRTGFGPAHNVAILWDKITGATLVRPDSNDSDQQEEKMAAFLGPEAVAKYQELKGKVGQIFVAYRDERGRLEQTDIPALLTDTAYLQEFQSRLGKRWLGETHDRAKVDKRLHTNPGFFKSVFVLLLLFGIVAAVGVVLLLGVAGPILNFMSIQKMLLDLQDGNFVSLGWRVASYVVLFVIGYMFHRVVRTLLDSRRRARPSRFPRTPFQP